MLDDINKRSKILKENILSITSNYHDKKFYHLPEVQHGIKARNIREHFKEPKKVVYLRDNPAREGEKVKFCLHLKRGRVTLVK